MVKWSAITMALTLSWPEVLAVAYGQVDLAEAQELAFKRKLADRGLHNLVGMGDIALMFACNMTVARLRMQEEDAPVSVATIGKFRAWYASDIEAYKDGQPLPARTKGELQGQLLTTRDIAHITGLKHRGLPQTIRQKEWHRIPPPDGKVSGLHYWDKTAVERWQRERTP